MHGKHQRCKVIWMKDHVTSPFSAHGVPRRSRIVVDEVTNETVRQELEGDDRKLYYYGENVGLITFQDWFPTLELPRHMSHMATYDFPVRLKFVPDPFDSVPFLESPPERRGWNLDAWKLAALELQEQGVRAIVGGCGLTGNIQSAIQSVVELPVYMSTTCFVPEFVRALEPGQKVGILTIGDGFMRGHDDALFKECGIDPDGPIVVQGIYESDQCERWLQVNFDDFDQKDVEDAVVQICMGMIEREPAISQFVFECTSLPPFSKAVEIATGKPVFDAVDMMERVNAEVSNN